jgi:hypothetical protein
MTPPPSSLPKLLDTRLEAGVWRGVVAAEAPPALTALHRGQSLPGVAVAALPGPPGQHAVTLPIPVEVLSDGVEVILLMAGEHKLGQITLIAGEAAGDDLRAEVALLREELDLLKRAFRRQLSERGGAAGTQP